MPGVFISYANENRDAAQALARVMEARGFPVWWDRQLIPGNTYADVIEEKLDAADAVVVLWSEFSRKSYWVRDEAAVGRDRNRLVPVALDDRPPPLGFRQIQTADFSGWNLVDEARLAPLWEPLASLCGTPSAPAAASPAPSAEAPEQRAKTAQDQKPARADAQPNNRPIDSILKGEKRQRSFVRTFWLTSFGVALVMALVISAFSGVTSEFNSGGAIVNALAGFVWVGVCLTIGRFFIVVGRRLSKRKSVRYFDTTTLTCLAISIVVAALIAFSESGKVLSDRLFLLMLVTAVVFPLAAIVSIAIGYAKGARRTAFEDGK